MCACLIALNSFRNDGYYLAQLALPDDDLSNIKSPIRSVRMSLITMIIVSIGAATEWTSLGWAQLLGEA